MADDEFDIDALHAFLDESDDEEMMPDKACPDDEDPDKTKQENACDPDTPKALVNEVSQVLEKETSKQLADDFNKDNADLDTIQAFLEGSDDEDWGDIGDISQTDVVDEDVPQGASEPVHSNSNKQKSEEELSKAEMQAQLQQMEEAMQKLKEKILKSPDQGQVSSKKPNGPENKGKTTPEVIKKPTIQCNNPTAEKSPVSSTNLKLKEGKTTAKPRTLKEMDTNPFFDNGGSGFYKKSKTLSSAKSDSGGMAAAVFGSDDSDEGDVEDGKQHLSKQGKEIKNMIKSGSGNRQAHVPSYDVSKVMASKNSQTWKSKVTPDEVVKQTKISQTADKNCQVEPFSGITIINPKVSSSFMKSKMEGRKMIKMSQLQSKQSLTEVDWITVGVIIQKTETRKGSNGKNFIIVKLSDLDDCDHIMALFLFGEAYTQLWKTTVGTVIGLLNAEPMKETDKSRSNEVAFSINHPGKVMILGQSKDFGICKSTTKAGKPCTSFVNKSQGGHCTYHIQQAYKRVSSKRGELQSIAGRQPKTYEKSLKKAAGADYRVGSDLYSTTMCRQKTRNSVSLKAIKQHATSDANKKISSATIHALLPEDEAKLQELKGLKQEKITQKQEEFLEMLAKPTPGSMHLIASMKQKDMVLKENKEQSSVVKSVKVSDFLKEQKKEMQKFGKKSSIVLPEGPKLGRGLKAGQDIILFDSPKPKALSKNAEFAKKSAIAKVIAKGGLKKVDPNAVRRKDKSPEHIQAVRKRVQEDAADSSFDEDKQSAGPPKKKSRLLGDLDLDSEEVQKLLKKKSMHTGIIAEAEAERQEKYFNVLEKKEKMEEKMASVIEKDVSVVYCKICDYTAFTQSDLCKQQGHQVKRSKQKQRFFKCKHCQERTTSFDRLPKHPCKKCGSTNYERVSMYREKKGPKLPQEELLLRGEEIKYLNSLQS